MPEYTLPTFAHHLGRCDRTTCVHCTSDRERADRLRRAHAAGAHTFVVEACPGCVEMLNQKETTMTMDDEAKQLLMEVAGFLALLAKGIPVPNQQDQAAELFDKVGAAVIAS